jgi:hypothetical protein
MKSLMFIRKSLVKGTYFGRIHYNVLNGQSALGLILFHMVYGITNTEFSFY